MLVITLGIAAYVSHQPSLAQQRFNTTAIELTSTDAFRDAPKNWKIVGDLKGGPDDKAPIPSKGTGILFNDYSDKVKYKSDANLFTKLEHSDVLLELDFMMPKGSNSGIYFQGRYEIQLYDSWKTTDLHSFDCGSIYDRWDDSRPQGRQGFEGHPPRVNASFAPNTWQHLVVEFEAPRFNASGKKISPARFVKVTLNGVVLHENIVLSGPTRSAAFSDEQATGPIMIQGDHGPVAFRNIRYAMLNDFSVAVKDLKYTYYEGKFPDFAALTPEKITRTAKAAAIDARLADNPNASAIVFEGTLTLPDADHYQFTIKRFGLTSLFVDGEEIIKAGELFGEESAVKSLSKGDHTFRLRYLKNFSWAPSGVGLSIGRPNARPFVLNVNSSLPFIQPEPPIRVLAATEPEVIRSFMWHRNKKMTHVISVGAPERLNFSYNLDQGGLMKIWRGDFLNVTDMWYERGEPQTAAPMGAVINLSGRGPLVGNFPTPDSIPMAYAGYRLNDKRTPVFTYKYGHASLEDYLRPAGDGDGLVRTLTLKGATPQSVAYLLAEGQRITQLGNNLFSIDQQYFVKLAEGIRITPEIRSEGNRQLLVISSSSLQAVEYSIIW